MLIFQLGPRGGQGLLIAGNLGPGIDDIERRQGTYLQLLPVVGKQLGGLLQSAFLGLFILIGAYQAPIHVFDLIDGIEQLRAKGNIGNAAIVLRDSDIASVHRPSKALQQVLRDLGVEGRRDRRAVEVAEYRVHVAGAAGVVESDGHRFTRQKPLRVIEVVFIRVRIELKCAGKKLGCLWNVCSRQLHGTGHDRIERLQWHIQRARAQSGRGNSIGAGGRASRADGSTAWTSSRSPRRLNCGGGGGACRTAGAGGAGGSGGRGTGHRAGAAAQRPGHQAGIHAQEGKARAGAQKIGVSNVQVIAGNGDVEVVLERQHNGVVQAEIDFAVLIQRIEQRAVAQARRRDRGVRVGGKWIWKLRFPLGKILTGRAKRIGPTSDGLRRVGGGDGRRRDGRSIGHRLGCARPQRGIVRVLGLSAGHGHHQIEQHQPRNQCTLQILRLHVCLPFLSSPKIFSST